MVNQIKEIFTSLEEEDGIDLLVGEKDHLDSLKEELSRAFREFHDSVQNEKLKKRMPLTIGLICAIGNA